MRTLLFFTFVILSGCSTPWASYYRPAYQLEGVELAPRDSAGIVEVEWERLAQYERAARDRAIRRDDRPDQLDPALANRELQNLLDTLRIDAAPDSVLVLGSSRFVATELLNPFSADVRTLAAREGGDVAVVSVEPLGVRETVEYATRTEWYERDVYNSRGRRGGGRVEFRSEERIPVVVPRETWGYTMIVLRIDDPALVRSLTGGRPWLP